VNLIIAMLIRLHFLAKFEVLTAVFDEHLSLLGWDAVSLGVS